MSSCLGGRCTTFQTLESDFVLFSTSHIDFHRVFAFYDRKLLQRYDIIETNKTQLNFEAEQIGAYASVGV